MTKLKDLLSGFTIGASMSIPGISGGTIAIILGVYNRLLYSVSNIFKHPKEHIPFLCMFALGGVLGFGAAAVAITWVLDTPAGVPLRFAFFGAAAGCIPPILKTAKIKPLSAAKILCLLCGIAAAVAISLIPEGLFSAPADDLGGFLLRMLGGFIVAVALVLPGVSASQMLYVMGLYEQVMQQVSQLDLLPLIPLCIGLAVGVFLTAKLLSAAFARFDGVYLVVLGFLIFSLKDLLPQWSSTPQLVIGIISAAAGFALALVITKREKNHDIVEESA